MGINYCYQFTLFFGLFCNCYNPDCLFTETQSLTHKQKKSLLTGRNLDQDQNQNTYLMNANMKYTKYYISLHIINGLVKVFIKKIK